MHLSNSTFLLPQTTSNLQHVSALTGYIQTQINTDETVSVQRDSLTSLYIQTQVNTDQTATITAQKGSSQTSLTGSFQTQVSIDQSTVLAQRTSITDSIQQEHTVSVQIAPAQSPTPCTVCDIQITSTTATQYSTSVTPYPTRHTLPRNASATIFWVLLAALVIVACAVTIATAAIIIHWKTSKSKCT